MRTALAALAGLMIVSSPAMAGQPKGVPQPDHDGVTMVSAEDEAMNAAIAQARATFGVFTARLDAGRLSSRDMAKVGFTLDGGGEEHIWVADVRRRGRGFVGILTNDPVWMPQARGDEVAFTESMISDWSYESQGRLWGNFTTRAVLPGLPPSQAAELRAILSATPLED